MDDFEVLLTRLPVDVLPDCHARSTSTGKICSQPPVLRAVLVNSDGDEPWLVRLCGPHGAVVRGWPCLVSIETLVG